MKKSPLPAQRRRPGSLPLAGGAIKSLSSTDGAENREQCGAWDARVLRGLPRARGVQGTQRLLGRRLAEDHVRGQARLSTAGYSRLPMARTDPTFPTPSLCSCPGHGGSPPKACRRPPTRATPAQHTPRLRLETSPWRAIPKCKRPGGRGRHPAESRSIVPIASREPAGHRPAARVRGSKSAPHSLIPRGPLGRCRHKGDARVTHLVPRGPGSRSSSLRVVAMAPPGAGSRVPLPRQPPACSTPRSAASFMPPRPAPRELRAGSTGRERALSAGAGGRASLQASAPCRSEAPQCPCTQRVAPSHARGRAQISSLI